MSLSGGWKGCSLFVAEKARTTSELSDLFKESRLKHTEYRTWRVVRERPGKIVAKDFILSLRQ